MPICKYDKNDLKKIKLCLYVLQHTKHDEVNFTSPKIPLKFRRISVRAQLSTEGCAGEFQRKFRDDSSELCERYCDED